MRTEGGISWLPSRFETEKRRGRSGCGKTRPIKEQSTTGAEAHTDSTCLTRPWKGRSSTVVHAFVVFPQPPKPCPRKPVKTGRPKAAVPTCSLLVSDPIHKRAQLPRARGMAQLAQRLGFDLANAFAGYRERLSDLFQSVLAAVF